MAARRLMLTVATLLCGLAFVFGATSLAVADGATQLGSTETHGNNGEGSGAGQLLFPGDVAVDNNPSSLLFYGDVYVADQGNSRIDRFSGSGVFQSAWGWGVTNGADELQTCTTTCQSAPQEEGAPFNTGAISRPKDLAVDNDPLSSSSGDVYVIEDFAKRVEKFSASGEFLLMFGGDVNETTGGDVCVAGEKCKEGTEGSANGQFELYGGETSDIAVGPAGGVYVGDRARVQVFEPSGVWRESISLSGLSTSGSVSALAVDASGDVFVKDNEAAGVREFEPGGSETGTDFDASSTSITGIAVDGSGDVFVGDSTGGFHVLKYKPSGQEVASFGSKTVRLPKGGFGNGIENGHSDGMALSEASGEDKLFVPEFYSVTGVRSIVSTSSVWVLPIPLPGPTIEEESANPSPREGATLEARVNPQNKETSYHFEYVTEANFKASGYADASSTQSSLVGAGFEEHAVSTQITGLLPNTVYHYRLVAANSESVGAIKGVDQTFEAPPPAYIDSEYVTDVASTSATIGAEVNPLESLTEYRLEYGTSASYGQVLTGSVGEGIADVLVSYHLQEFLPGTTYHYRIVVHNEFGTVEGADQTFTTQPPGGGELTLPDGRAWELVSPPDKKGGVIEPFNVYSDIIQAADDGSGIAYVTMGPAVGENPASKSIVSYVLSQRGHIGWTSTDIDAPRRSVKEGESAHVLDEDITGSEYPLFSADLSLAALEPSPSATPLLSPEATERTLYLRDNATGSFLPLVTPADVPAGTQFGGEEKETVAFLGELYMRFVTATPDLSHVVLSSPLVLTPEAVTRLEPRCEYLCGPQNLYEWGDGQLRLVNVLPNGEVAHGSATEAIPPSPKMPGENELATGLSAHPVSVDGRWIAWSWGTPYGTESTDYRGLYVRDMVDEKTFQVGGPDALYQSMSSDGSRVFFLENGELYEFNTSTDTQTDLTADHGASEANAGVQASVSDVSKNGSYVYFVAKGVLANGGVSSEDNLYLLRFADGDWSTTYIATLSTEDEKSWRERTSEEDGQGVNLEGISSRVSPDGRYLAFMSNRSLTGYDNIDAISGQPDEEVYLYDASADRLVCASCDPTGARPTGALDGDGKRLLADNNAFWAEQGSFGIPSHWLAGSIPGWEYRNDKQALYEWRYLSDSGRLFFDSADALVPQDTNGLEDVYEYEPSGVGDCATMDVTYSVRSEGCVNLVSSGTSSGESVFYDASENGDDVFFITSSRLAAADYDASYDVYDAHVCTESVPCVSAPVSPPPCTSGDSCKPAPSPQPEIFGPTPSATFSGAGNVVEEAKKSAVKTRSKPKRKIKAKKQAKRKKAKGRKAKKVGVSSTRGKDGK